MTNVRHTLLPKQRCRMGSKWSLRRRRAISSRILPTPGPQPTYGQPCASTGTSQSVVRTEVVVNQASGSNRPKTVITIRRSHKQPASTTASATASSPAKSQLISSHHSLSHMPNVVAATSLPADHREHSGSISCSTPAIAEPEAVITSMADIENDLETFGIDIPRSPSSTLNDLSSHSYTQPKLVAATSTSEMSMFSVATAVDDGLSPWGLPRPMDTTYYSDYYFDHDDRGYLEYEELAGSTFGPLMLQSAHPYKPERVLPPNEGVNKASIRVQLVLRLVYAMELVASYRLRKHKKFLASLHSNRSPALISNRVRINDLNISHFGSWV